jgi:hypothetical protein
MSDREKKLVLLFGLAAFVLLNAFGVRVYRQQKTTLASQLIAAEGEVQNAEAFARKFDTVIEEMDWMGEHAPEKRAGQLVASELEQYASNQATTNQLTVKRRAILANEESGTYFHRARAEFNVTGMEASLYRWLGRLQMPDQFRGITFLRLSPDTKDDTLIDCTVIVEQWYDPLDDEDGGGTENVEQPAPTPAPAPAPPEPTPSPDPAPPAPPAPSPTTPPADNPGGQPSVPTPQNP